MDIQNQILQNSDDLQMFMRDLESWENEMKKKEEEFRLIKVSEEEDFPPVRNSVSKSKKKGKHKKQKEKISLTKTDKISALNYQAWDKFDVDSELKKLDDEQKESTSDSSSGEEKLEMQKKQQMAILKKDKGNEYFKIGNYDLAINCYTAGMELDPENPLLPANRAMAFLRKEQFQAAENDCNLCLLIDSTYVKAYLRRGSARIALKKLNLAREDFLKALELEPDNKQAKIELDKLKVSIEDVTDCKEFEEKTVNKVSKAPSKKSTQESSKHKASSSVKKDIDLDMETQLNDIQGIIRTLQQSLPPVPTASFQFLTDWKTLSEYPEMKYKYLKQFPPQNFPVVFQHSMEAELFPEILHILFTYFTEIDEIFVYLKYLSKVGRFRTMLMFLSKKEKTDLYEILNLVQDSNHPPAEVGKVIQSYKL